MRYRFCGDKLQLVKYEISVTYDDEHTEVYTAVNETEKDELLQMYPASAVTEIDNTGYEWLGGRIFTQEQLKCGELEKAVEMGREAFEKYIMDSDPTYQMLDLDMRVALLEMGVNYDDISVD